MTGDVRRPTVFAAPSTPTASASAPAPDAPSKPPSGVFPAPPAEEPRTPPSSSATLERLAKFSELARQGGLEAAPPAPPPTPAAAPVESPEEPFGPLPEPPPAGIEPPPRLAEEPAADISFGETASAPPVPAEPAVKHVKVRSSVDILSELDKLRKLSTQKAPAGAQPPKSETLRAPKAGVSIDDLLASNLNHKKDVTRSFDLTVPRQVLGRSRQVTIELKFSDGAGSPLPTDSSFSIDLSSPADLQKLLLSLRFNVQAE